MNQNIFNITIGERMMKKKKRKRRSREMSSMMLNKKLEKYFFEKRAVYLWGVVDDKSAKEVVSKFFCLMLINPVKKLNFISIVRVVWLPVEW